MALAVIQESWSEEKFGCSGFLVEAGGLHHCSGWGALVVGGQPCCGLVSGQRTLETRCECGPGA